MQNGEPGGSPFLLFSLGRPQNRRVLADYDWPGFAADAHRMRGVISLCFALSPVESYRLFPWQVSSRLLGYAHVLPNARGIQHTKFRSSRLEKKGVETH